MSNTTQLLRFITAGSVDDGKSTLIGRLLYESKRLYADHLQALATESAKLAGREGALDFALLCDGLAAQDLRSPEIAKAFFRGLRHALRHALGHLGGGVADVSRGLVVECSLFERQQLLRGDWRRGADERSCAPCGAAWTAGDSG